MRSKVDRITDAFKTRVRDAIDSVIIDLHAAGEHGSASVLRSRRDQIVMRTGAYTTYERLELDDIIKGHKRAWPE